MRCPTLFFVCFVSVFSAFENSAAADNATRYVQMTKAITLQDGSVIPRDAYVAIKYDGGDSWITSDSAIAALRIPKAAANLVDAVSFSPAIEGTANQLASLYRRVALPNQMQATALQPNATGLAIPKGDTIKIAAREGGYYLIETSKYRSLLTPVSAINVARLAPRGNDRDGSIFAFGRAETRRALFEPTPRATLWKNQGCLCLGRGGSASGQLCHDSL